MLNYDTAEKLFKNGEIRELASTEEGMRFLKLRSLSRKEQMEYLITQCGIEIFSKKSREWLEILFESDVQAIDIDRIIISLYEKERSDRRRNENKLVNELYKIQSFEWGGLHQNSLEKTIVNNYVKKIDSYESLNKAIENDLHNSMRAYVLASWYNHWSSILIEDIFKDHAKVIPAVGLIKKIDFFVNGKPFDLKVTYFPEGYVKYCRKELGLRPELTLMKAVARELDLAFDKSYPDSVLIPDLWRKLDDHPSEHAGSIITDLQKCREELLETSIAKPEKLARWLYENQGVRRFDASNRLFLVLIDKSNLFESWKLKRAKSLISRNVYSYLDNIMGDIGFQVEFQWESETYTAESEIIYVVKE